MVTRRREESWEKTLGTFIGGVAWRFLLAWLLMLAAGVLHSQWPAVPPIGFWVALVLSVIASGLIKLLKKR